MTKKFNPMLTHGEFMAMSPAEQAEWRRQELDSVTENPQDQEPRGFNDELFTNSGTRKGGMQPWETGE